MAAAAADAPNDVLGNHAAGSASESATPAVPDDEINLFDLLPVEILQLIWLRLARGKDHIGAQSLMASCRVMRAACSNFVHSLDAKLPGPQQQQQQQQDAGEQPLVRFPRHAVLNRLRVDGDHSDFDAVPDHSGSLGEAMSSGLRARGPQLLDHVQSVRLGTMKLYQRNSLLPMVAFLPALQNLHLRNIHFRSEDVLLLLALRQLRNLEIISCCLVLCRDGDVLQPLSHLAGNLRSLDLADNRFFGPDGNPMNASLDVLRQLTNLQHLHLDTDALDEASAQALAGNLHSIKLHNWSMDYRFARSSAWPLCFLSNLTTFVLVSWGEMDGDAFDVLLALPSLRDVTMMFASNISLKPGTAGAECRWSHLAVAPVMAPSAVAELPLASIQDISNSSNKQLELVVRPGDDVAVYTSDLHAAVANLVRSAGIKNLKSVSLLVEQSLDEAAALALLRPFAPVAAAAPAATFKLDRGSLKLTSAQFKAMVEPPKTGDVHGHGATSPGG